MTETTLLAQLAAELGVQTQYYNFRGEHLTVPEASQRAIIESMGFGTDEPQLGEALARQATAHWHRLLPAAVVLWPEDPRVVHLHVPASLREAVLPWRLRCENGRVLEGEMVPRDLHCVAHAQVEGADRYMYRAALPDDLPEGYHELLLRLPEDGTAEIDCRVIVVPERCHEPEAVVGGERLWGVSVQLYTLRSEHNWGIGDFGDLRRLAPRAAALGADVIGLNPLHALFPADPGQYSPYRPSSRLFLHTLYIDVPGIDEYADCRQVQQLVGGRVFRERLEGLRGAGQVEYRGVAALKMAALRMLFQHFHAQHLAHDSDRARAFRDYVADGGQELQTQALFEALHAHFARRPERSSGWRDWPAEYHDPASDAVVEFALEHRDAIDFYLYLQWIAHDQLAAAQRAALDAGMRIGLYRDLAVGVASEGAETWARRDLYALDASVGAPPDELALRGQDWGLPPFVPQRLRDDGFRTFSAMIAANMRECGALRLDHVMSLLRLWWVPPGEDASAGAYVGYPFRELLGVLTLESRRAECLVIGEDLGTVPDEIRQTLPAAAVYSYRVLMFEKRPDGSFRAPGEYPRRALATVTTHDLPPLASYWDESDIDLRERLGLYPDETVAEQQREQRARDRSALCEALAAEELIPRDDPPAQLHDRLGAAIHAFLARSDAAVTMVQPEDWLGMRSPVNVPGTTGTVHANWQRKLTVTVEELLEQPAARSLFQRMRDERHR